MKLRLCAALVCSWFGAMAPGACSAQARQTGSLEFSARVTPTEGPAEPVRMFSFFLLRKSLAEIRGEVEQSEAPLALEQFIDGLDASPELKAWMETNHTVDMVGSAFIKRLAADDIVTVPEFLEAYKNLNGAALHAGIPDAKVTEADRVK